MSFHCFWQGLRDKNIKYYNPYVPMSIFFTPWFRFVLSLSFLSCLFPPLSRCVVEVGFDQPGMNFESNFNCQFHHLAHYNYNPISLCTHTKHKPFLHSLSSPSYVFPASHNCNIVTYLFNLQQKKTHLISKFIFLIPHLNSAHAIIMGA